MQRRIFLSAMAVIVLGGCAAAGQSSTPSLYHCDRNGEREQRVAC